MFKSFYMKVKDFSKQIFAKRNQFQLGQRIRFTT